MLELRNRINSISAEILIYHFSFSCLFSLFLAYFCLPIILLISDIESYNKFSILFLINEVYLSLVLKLPIRITLFLPSYFYYFSFTFFQLKLVLDFRPQVSLNSH